MDLLQQVFESKNVKIFSTVIEDEDGEDQIVPYFCTRDICEILNTRYEDVLDNNNDAISLESIFDNFKAKFNHNDLQEYYINKKGLEYIISSKKNGPEKLQKLIEEFKLNFTTTPIKEPYIEAIEQTFAGIQMYEQFKVGSYRIDLYMEDYDLVIEFNHKECKDREEYIKHKLQCEYMRFDPNSKHFSIFGAIGNIHRYIMSKKNHKIELLKQQINDQDVLTEEE
jgi:hypothetical protein